MNKIEKYVNDCYLAVLGRPAEKEGLGNYSSQIQSGTLKKEDLTKALRASEEYHSRMDLVRNNKDIGAFIKSKYLEILHRAVDVGGLAHYTQEFLNGDITEDGLVQILNSSAECKTKFVGVGKIVFCQGTYEERMDQTKKCVEQIQPGKYVDRAVIIVDETVTEESKKWLEEHGCEVYAEQWEDSMVKMRNQYLSRLKYGDWCVVSDPDELYSHKICQELRLVIENSNSEGYGLLLLASHDNTKMFDGSVSTAVSGFHKNLIFKYLPDVYYDGAGESKNVHEILNLPEGTKVFTLHDKYFYTHYKTEEELLDRSFRNVFMGGGGLNASTTNPHFHPLRDIGNKLGLDTWPKMRDYLRAGEIDKGLLEWIESVKDVKGTDYLNETQQCYNYYKAIHPEELE